MCVVSSLKYGSKEGLEKNGHMKTVENRYQYVVSNLKYASKEGIAGYEINSRFYVVSSYCCCCYCPRFVIFVALSRSSHDSRKLITQ